MLPNPDPRLIKAQIDGVKSAIEDLSRAANRELVLVKNRETRLALASLNCAIDLLLVLVTISSKPYLEELDRQINIVENREKYG
ncbi:MAG TPA: hypothetical protein VI794_02985 [Patescibacteria group bacterium]|nr:hypothetical protein [Patescibacteria group bacterium]